MDTEKLFNRIVRRLTTPAEVLFALTRHWVVISVGLLVGGGLVLAKVSTEPPTFLGTATLLITQGDALVLEGAAAKSRYVSRTEAEAFFSSRVEILRGDSVVHNLVEHLKPANIFAQDVNPEEKNYGRIRRLVSRVKRWVSDALAYLEHPDVVDVSEEGEVQKAVGAFRRRSAVVPNRKTGMVELRVYGVNRTQIEKELDRWIESYINRLVTMIRKSRDTFVDSRMAHWRQIEAAAKKSLDDYILKAKENLEKLTQEKNAEISETAQNLILQEALQMQMLRNDLMRQLENPDSVPLAQAAVAPVRDSLDVEKNRLEAELAQARAYYAEESDKVQRLKEQLRNLDPERRGVAAGDGGGGEEKDARRARLETRIKSLSATVTELFSRYAAIGREVEKIKSLEEELKVARQMRRNYERMSYEEQDKVDARKTIQVQVSDEASVGWKPVNTYPHMQVVYGGFGGLAVGMVFAILLELLCGRVRFRNDIVGEFGIPVVGVIPKK